MVFVCVYVVFKHFIEVCYTVSRNKSCANFPVIAPSLVDEIR